MKQSVQKPLSKQAEHKPRTDTDNIQSDFAPELEAVTPQNIHYLQRTIGNQATLKLVQRQQNPVHQRTNKSTIQRVETGLRDSGTSSGVVNIVHAFANDAANADKHPRELLPIIMNAINAELTKIEVPPTRIEENGAGGANGTFSFRTWVINLNSERKFRGKTKISELSKGEIASTVRTLYHESRHCEQWFRVARLLAGQHVARQQAASGMEALMDMIESAMNPALKVLKDIAEIATDINKRTKIPMNISMIAATKPLEPDSGQASEEANEWLQSIYGSNRTYRNMMLGSLKRAVKPLTTPTRELVNLVKLKEKASTDHDKEQTQLEIDNLIMNINALLEHVYAVRDSTLQAEFDRLSALGSPSAVETTMLTHITNINGFIDQIKAISLDASTAQSMKTLVGQLAGERYQAYHDLPEEDDAHETGDTAQDQYRSATVPAPAGP